jgi:Tfp pilus assembly protein PilV
LVIKGQTLVETAAALGVVAVVVAALIAMGIAGMRATTFSKNRTMAELIANEALEAMRAKKNNSTDFAADFPDGSCFQMSSTAPRAIIPGAVACTSFQTYQQGAVVTNYLYKIEVLDAVQGGVDGKLIRATVRFTDSGGDHDNSVETFFTSWQ